jgi:hypothetical protein
LGRYCAVIDTSAASLAQQQWYKAATADQTTAAKAQKHVSMLKQSCCICAAI